MATDTQSDDGRTALEHPDDRRAERAFFLLVFAMLAGLAASLVGVPYGYSVGTLLGLGAALGELALGDPDE